MSSYVWEDMVLYSGLLGCWTLSID